MRGNQFGGGWSVRFIRLVAISVCWGGAFGHPADARDLEQGIALETQLRSADPDRLVEEALAQGKPARGAILFHGPMLGCGKCHSVSDTGPDLLGPNLAAPRPEETPGQLVDSILRPSQRIAETYRSARVLTEDGQVITGMPIPQLSDEKTLVLRHLETLQDIRLARDEIAQLQWAQQSVMPDGLVRGLANRQEFLDLLRYLVEIRDGGPQRARELQPTAAQLAIRLPEYEADIDHAGMIRDLDKAAIARGEKIYNSLCINCHGTLTQRGSLDTALRFGEGKFKHGNDPYSMYQTLTRGAGLMLPQPWMVPKQKYDVIHYIRERFLKGHNPSQYFEVTEPYLASLPVGSQRGPEPQPFEPWSQADYGPRLVNTYEIGSGGRNIAQKGIAIQLDDAPGGVAHGRAWAVFEHDTMRLAGVWTSRGFIDWQGIHFNGRHGIHPHVVGDILLANPTAPGWGDPDTGSLEDDARIVGRDGKRYGPLPRRWAQFRGIHQLGRNSVIEYQVGQTPVLETYRWSDTDAWDTPLHGGVFQRLLRLGGRPRPLRLVAATLEENEGQWRIDGSRASAGALGTQPESPTVFDGRRYFEAQDAPDIDLIDRDFTVVAKVRTTGDGTIFARAPAEGAWAPGGQTLFIRGGRLCYDVGWVGAVQSDRPIADGHWHTVALTWDAETELARLWIDGRMAGKKKLRPKEKLDPAVFRIGMTSPNFPGVSLLQSGEIQWVRLYDAELQGADLGDRSTADAALMADWDLQSAASGVVPERCGRRDARLRLTDGSAAGHLQVGFQSDGPGMRWTVEGRKLVLEVPQGDAPLDLVVWSARVASDAQQSALNRAVASPLADARALDVENPELMQPVFPESITTDVLLGGDLGGFAVDVLTIPKNNPWRARVRTSGHDFFSDGDRMAVSTWDGDVWVVGGISQLDAAQASPKLTWRRVAFGLFQPLGVRVIEDQIYLTCRDQLVRLEDRNGDGEADFYRCINNDHQVTEHFHEFAMGLQTDAEGNFYYAKSARHALTAIVPQHGTLLRVSRDGARTDIIATGFRAANGVCLNPDGTFIVTDQEGHWNPKNRINWVRPGGFYGNMYGYHDVTDESDSAMEQPLCWITNKFDRSPAELLWVDSEKWGPLNGRLLNLSYGYGRIYVVPHERVEGQVQGGMCALPIPDFPTGIMRGRFSPFDNQLYVCGLSAWATNQVMEEGGIYRVRFTGRPVGLPVELSARRFGMQITFTEPLAADTPLDPERFHVEAWDLRRTKNYGSDHYNQRQWPVRAVRLSQDRMTLTLEIPDIAPTWGMEIRMPIRLADGREVERVIHNTIHKLSP